MRLRARGLGAEAEADAPAALSPRVLAVRSGNAVWVHDRGETYVFERVVARAAGHAGAEEDLFAPMPGKVLKLRTEEGATVEKGAPLLVLEAMKMEHEIRAPRAGRVKKLPFRAGDMVSVGDVLAEIE